MQLSSLHNEVMNASDNVQELRVNFHPELFLQRRIWILNILRKENITRVLDVGCGEGQLLAVLCQPAPWLIPPPPSILPPLHTDSSKSADEDIPASPVYSDVEEIPSLHMTEVHGLDISDEDLKFAVEAITPPEKGESIENHGYPLFHRGLERFEELFACVWKGGLEAINVRFVDMECIVSTEVIEHLPPDIFRAFAPMLLGVYHPKFLLITTPSYTFNARFTPPDAPKSVRSGYPDPTGRTDRIFRHHDHKFEWTKDEFEEWCDKTAEEWGYDVERTTIGRAYDPDPWGRDDELEGASSVAIFRRREDLDSQIREVRGRAKISELELSRESHEVLATFTHVANPSSKSPMSLQEIAKRVKVKMEEYREAFMRLEQLWFEAEISIACGGWIEFLVRAVEQSEYLNLKRDIDGVQRNRSLWNVELIGGVANPSNIWEADANTSLEFIPPDWTPGEGPYESWDESRSDVDESAAIEGDISANTSGEEAVDDWDSDSVKNEEIKSRWQALAQDMNDDDAKSAWSTTGAWGTESIGWGAVDNADWSDVPPSAKSSATGWDGDESVDTTS